MSWASKRRALYVGGVILFFLIIISIPVAKYFLSIKPTCFDGRQDGGETAVDEGGPCVKLNPADLSPLSTLWARAFQVRDGSYTAVAYLENPNQGAGVAQVDYQFSLYDAANIEIAEQDGTAAVLPGGITPILETGIDTGNRVAVHTYFKITDDNLDWEAMTSPASAVAISNQTVSNTDSMPRITALATNTSFASFYNVRYVVVVFDPSGNAIAASQTLSQELDPSTPQQITFTWPAAFGASVGRIDIIPLLAPQQASAAAH